MPQREDESLIEEMRQTIRADRERAAARVVRPVEPVAVAAPAPPPAPEPTAASKGLFGRLLRR